MVAFLDKYNFGVYIVCINKVKRCRKGEEHDNGTKCRFSLSVC